jgi:hypothetical protein
VVERSGRSNLSIDRLHQVGLQTNLSRMADRVSRNIYEPQQQQPMDRLKIMSKLLIAIALTAALSTPALAVPETGTPKARDAVPGAGPLNYRDNVRYRENAHGFNCWKSQVVPTNAAWRMRQVQRGTCY